MQEHYHKFYTQYLSRDIEMLVFGHSGYPIILFPTSKGRYYENKDFGLIESARYFLDEGKIKIYCPDGFDSESWYNYSIQPADRVKSHEAFERMILKDVIDFARYETGHNNVGLAGCSFGGYHAANLAFRHPEIVGYMFSMGGTFNIKPYIYGYYDDECYFNNPVDYLPNLSDPWFFDNLKWMEIIFGTGSDDICLTDNIQISRILSDKNIGHWLDVRQGFGHDWNYWKVMFPQYLSKIVF